MVPPMSPAKPLWLYAAPVIFLLLWSGGFSVAKLGIIHAEPLSFLALRYAAVCALLAPLVIILRPPLPQKPVRMGQPRHRRRAHPDRLFRPLLHRLQGGRLGGRRRHHRLPAAHPRRPHRAALHRREGEHPALAGPGAGAGRCCDRHPVALVGRDGTSAGRAGRGRRAGRASPSAPCGRSASARAIIRSCPMPYSISQDSPACCRLP